MGHMLDHREVVRDEDIGGAELLLQVHEQVQDLGLDRYIQRGYRFVGDHHRRVQGHGASYGDALTLAA